jgi:hypothetical protein
MGILKNGTIGATSGAIPGWITSIVSLSVARQLSPEQINYLVIAAVPFGWIPGMIGGFVGGAIGGENAARNGAIGGALITPIICSAIIIDDQLTMVDGK